MNKLVLGLLSLAVVSAVQPAFAGCAVPGCPTSAQASATASPLSGDFAYVLNITNTSPQGYGISEFLVNLQYLVPDGTFAPLSNIALLNVPSAWMCDISTGYGALICDVIGGAGSNPSAVVAPGATIKVTFTSTTTPSSSIPFGANFFTLSAAGLTCPCSGFDFNDSAPITVSGSCQGCQTPPVANAGPGQTVSPGQTFVLDGTSSFDPDGDTLTYSWTQTAGPTTSTSSNTSTPTPSYTAPLVTSQTTLTFQLTVSDGVFSNSASVDVVDTPLTTFSFGPAIALSPDSSGSSGYLPTVAASGSNVYAAWNCDTCTTMTEYSAVSFARSTDSGTSFGPATTLSPPPFTCKTSNPCRAGGNNAPPVVASFGNHVYVAWVDEAHGIFFTNSDDGGLTFPSALNVVSIGPTMGIPSQVQIAASGSSVYLLSYCLSCGTVGQGQLFFSVSADFGQSFTTTILSNTSPGCCGQMVVSKNNVYIVWQETVPPFCCPGVAVVKFAESANNGATLSTAIVLSDPSHASYFPQMAVSGSQVYVAWDDPTTNEVMLSSSADGGATFGSAINLPPGMTGGSVLPGVAAYGSNIYALSAPPSSPSIYLAASNNDGTTFAPQQVLNNSPLFVPPLFCYCHPQIAALGSSAYVVWTFTPPSSSTRDIAFAYSTNNGAAFGGAVNLSNNPDDSELTVGAPSAPISKVDEIAVSAGRVHIVWYDCVPTGLGTCVVKYVTGTLVPSAFSVSTSGAASTSVTTDPSGDTVISESDSSGNLLAGVTLPPSSSAPSGTMTLTESSTGLINQVQVSGVTVPYPPGKSITFLVDPAANAVCIDDEPSATLTATACTTGANNIPFNLACPVNAVTSSGPLPFQSGPSPRTYTCTILQGAEGSTYMQVTGLAFSAIESVVPPARAIPRLITVVKGMRLPYSIANSLYATLNAALRSIADRQNIAAIYDLNAFIIEVKAQTGKAITKSQAQTLVSDAQTVINVLWSRPIFSASHAAAWRPIER